MHLEVEQKYPVSDLPRLAEKLAAVGVLLAAPVEQRDMYFNHPAKNFKETDEALRLRRVGVENCITYKGPKVDAETKTRRELELPLAAGDSAYQQFTELLLVLGFVRVFEVRKQRAQAVLAWKGQRVHLAIDQVEGLGNFVELEISATSDALPQAKKCLASLAKFLDLGLSERRGYLDLLLENVT